MRSRKRRRTLKSLGQSNCEGYLDFLFCFSLLYSPISYSCLLLLVLPKILPFTFGDEPSHLGESTTVQCSVSVGDLPMKFAWKLNGKPVSEIAGIHSGAFGKKASVLSIELLVEYHAGNYTCVVENSAGTSSYLSELIVNGTKSVLICFDLFFSPSPFNPIYSSRNF
uniref:Ig-like domain-containing protein n=1 Tax=Photinus pyralis TaxID=7054 RepID=A0A1Y1M5H0_PHOPY